MFINSGCSNTLRHFCSTLGSSYHRNNMEKEKLWVSNLIGRQSNNSFYN